MGDSWKTIEGDGHVISLNDYSTLKVSKYRAEIQEQFQSIAQVLLSQATQQISLAKLAQSQMVLMQFQQINWICCLPEGIDCEILFLGQETWQKGKLRIKVSIDFPENLPNLAVGNSSDILAEIGIQKELPKTDLPIEVALEFLSSSSIEETESIVKQKLDLEIDRQEKDYLASPYDFTFKNNIENKT